MAFTQTELDELKQAYASGALRVVHEGKTVEYGSEADLLRRIRMVEGELKTTTGQNAPNVSFASFSRG
ncbi:MAG: hypothetical protein HQL76_06220 [Magnetococcales bacterium]|nr:hypothetical protein [Magnetococcales bacterium]MBF0148358.1 hypothetical protein [Magnetococcales bacterium]MBF0152094.1 hypothetical protein [Magnetococcales bacterium]